MCKYQSWFWVNQRWISAVQRWKSNVSEQKKERWTALIQSCFSLKQRCSALKQRWIFQFWNRADQRWCSSCSLNQRWKTSKLWNSAVQRWLPLGLQPGMLHISASETSVDTDYTTFRICVVLSLPHMFFCFFYWINAFKLLFIYSMHYI